MWRKLFADYGPMTDIEIENPKPAGTEQFLGPPQEQLRDASLSCNATSSSRWWHIADFGVFGLWIAVVGFILRHHEKWADEAQAWLIARDLDLRTIWFHELRYEGSPGLWHTILWVAQRVFHAKYGAIGYIGMAGATAGVALLIFKAPFPRIIRWPLAFTYCLVYQYAVIARPYTLLALLAFTAAILFKDIQHPERMTMVLVLLANLSVHGTILAGCFGLAYLIEAFRSWHTLGRGVRTRYRICVAAMVLTFLFLFIILKPTPDVEVFVKKREIAHLPPEAQAQRTATSLQKMGAILSGGFLDYRVPSVLFVALTGAWCFIRRRFLTFVVPVGAMIAMYSFAYGSAHHQGTVFVAAIAAVWIAWPTAEERLAFGVREFWAVYSMVFLLLCLCAVNIWDAAVVIRHEYLYPYSGAEDAARYLKSVAADRGPIFGYIDGVVGVQAYFDHNILTNIPTAYIHHGLPLHGTSLEVDELQQVNPEYLVIFSRQPEHEVQYLPQLAAQGYELAHFSDGYYLYKRTVYERQTYFILRRTRAPGVP